MAPDTLSAKSTSSLTSLSTSPAYWYVVSLLMVVGLGFVVGLTSCVVYRCYRRRRRSQPDVAAASCSSDQQRASYLQSVVCSRTGSDPMASGSVSQPKAVKDASHMRIMSPEVFKSAVFARLSIGTTMELSAEPDVRKSPQTAQLSGKLEVAGECDEKTALYQKSNVNDITTALKPGTLEFSVGYVRSSCALRVTIVGARHLASIGRTNLDLSSAADPYVKLQLLPDRRLKAKTRIAKKTVDPDFDETFTFYGLSYESLSSVTIHMAVLGFDRFSRDDVIGDVLFPLHKLDLDGKTLSFVRTLNRRDQSAEQSQNRGELLVSLCHQPAEGKLTVTVLKGRNLPKINVTGLADPYVKVYMAYRGQRIAKKRTRVVRCTLNPIFNESFAFSLVRGQTLKDTQLEFYTLDWDRVTKNEVLGRLRLGFDAQTDLGIGVGLAERKHWEELIQAPRRQVAVWHKLKA